MLDKVALARKLLSEGKTISDMAQPLGLGTKFQVMRFIRAHGMRMNPLNVSQYKEYLELDKMIVREELRKGPILRPSRVTEQEVIPMRPNNDARNEEIRRRNKEGESGMKLAKEFGLSNQRVYQILDPNYEENRRKYDAAKKLPADERTAMQEDHNIRSARKFLEREGVMGDRVFEAHKITDSGDLRNAVRVVCSTCSKQELFKKAGIIHPVLAAKYFVNKGWAVGSGPRADKCPACLKKLSMVKKEKQMEKANGSHVVKDFKDIAISTAVQPGPLSTAMAVSPPPPVPAPVQVVAPPTRSDRRIIHAKLEEVYGDETTGYKVGWNDAKVASDLGVSVQWVSDIRETDFGPDFNKNVEDFRRLHFELKSLAKAVKENIDRVEAAISSFDKANEDFKRRHDEFERLSKIIG